MLREIRRSVSSYAPPTSELDLPVRPDVLSLIDRVVRPLVGLGESAEALSRSMYHRIKVGLYRVRGNVQGASEATMASRRAWNRSTHIFNHVIHGRRTDPLYLILNSYDQDIDLRSFWDEYEYDIDDIVERVPLDIDRDRVRILNDLFSIRYPMSEHLVWNRILNRALDDPDRYLSLERNLPAFILTPGNRDVDRLDRLPVEGYVWRAEDGFMRLEETEEAWRAQGNDTVDDLNGDGDVSQSQCWTPHTHNRDDELNA